MDRMGKVNGIGNVDYGAGTHLVRSREFQKVLEKEELQKA